MPAAPAGGFPQTPPQRAGIITPSIDDTLVTPSAHMVSALIGRELGRNFAIEAGYVGRFGRDLLVRRDLAMPLNLVDTDVGHGLLHGGADADPRDAGRGHSRRCGGRGLRGAAPTLPYWENLFPGAAGGGLTATQAIARAFNRNAPDCITALYDMDRGRARRRAASSGRTRTSRTSTTRSRRSARSAGRTTTR